MDYKGVNKKTKQQNLEKKLEKKKLNLLAKKEEKSKWNRTFLTFTSDISSVLNPNENIGHKYYTKGFLFLFSYFILYMPVSCKQPLRWGARCDKKLLNGQKTEKFMVLSCRRDDKNERWRL